MVITAMNIQCDSLKCNNNCCSAFSGISSHLTPFGKLACFSDIILTNEDYQLLIKAGYAEFIEIGEEGLKKLKTLKDGCCCAYQQGKCTIYENRPTICRAYQFYIDIFAGLCVINDCPSAPNNDRIIEYAEDIKTVLAVYKYWIEYYERILNSADDNEQG